MKVWRIGVPPLPPAPNGSPVIGSDELFRPIPAPNDLVNGLMRRGSLNMLVAYAGSGKTWLLIDLMRAVATGSHWLGRFKCDQARVLLLDWENGAFEIHRRLAAIAVGDGRKMLRRVSACYEPGNLDTKDFEAWLSVAGTRYSLIIVDPLKAAAPEADENDSNVRGALDRLRRVAHATGCVVVVAHHAGKTGARPNLRQLARGSSAIADAVEASFAVTVTKNQSLKITCTKARHRKTPPPFFARISGDDLEGVRLEGADEEPGEDDVDRLADLEEKILDAVRQSPDSSGRDIERSVKGRAEDKRVVLRDLVTRGLILKRGTAGRPAYRVPKVAKRANGVAG